MDDGLHVSRRNLIVSGGSAAGAALIAAGCGAKSSSSAATPTPTTATTGAQFPHPADPAAALSVLQQGNLRYQNGQIQLRDYSPVGDRIAESQKPFVAIVTCADSRIATPLVFDIREGNLFESRVAGNSLDTGTLGSTEYAVAKLGAKLVLVMGHSDCGAVKAALEAVNGTQFPPSKYGAIPEVVGAIVPAVKALPTSQRTLDKAIAANVVFQTKAFAAKNPIIKPAIDSGQIKVVGAVYDLASGKVNLL
ncbi:MAG TPA: carbonic anhydrase [Solirubrobacteraceae bacterium]|nr:carbonic anhydrase [Solirubrobacteraceae bacterium]